MLRLSALARPFSTASPLRAAATATTTAMQSVKAPPKSIPKPNDKAKDVKSFLHYIGRNMDAVAAKVPSWEFMFSADSAKLKSAGLNPRQRKYLLLWTERYRQGRDLHMIKTSGKRK